jgi:hypothetical protein
LKLKIITGISKKYFYRVYNTKEVEPMINKIEAYHSQIAFGAKVNLDARCRKYYDECDTFKKFVDIMRNEMEASEVDLKSDFISHWSGTRRIYALCESYKGGFNEFAIGEIDTRPVKFVANVNGETVLKGPDISFHPEDGYIAEAIKNNDDKKLAQELDVHLYWSKGPEFE